MRAPEAIGVVLRGIGEGGGVAYAALIVWSYAALFPSQVSTSVSTLGIPQYTEGLAVGVSMALTLVALVWRRFQLGFSARGLIGIVLGIGFVTALETLPLPPAAAGLIGVLGLILMDAPDRGRARRRRGGHGVGGRPLLWRPPVPAGRPGPDRESGPPGDPALHVHRGAWWPGVGWRAT